MPGECHAHMIMDGKNYRQAVSLHKDCVQEEVIHAHFRAYQERGITFVRDGGDALGVSKRAREIAAEYGIDYRTPIYAIHQKGHYGSIVGKAFEDLREYTALVREAKKEGADFIKIMTTGILDFEKEGQITGSPLDSRLVKEMVHIAHEEGMAVMSHTNGVYGVQAAIAAGADSLEHGNYMDRETLGMLADSDTVWVPTLVTIRNLVGDGRYEDSLLKRIQEAAAENLRLAYELGVKTACGSDAGAYRVLHGQGIEEEYSAFLEILGDSKETRAWIEAGEAQIRRRFSA